jgi:2-polyprenyl-3-methyl-5-hydroxy-6-metoxy-1,4-benzoquinol methylase
VSSNTRLTVSLACRSHALSPLTTVTSNHISAGHFARKQLHCSDPVIAWSHRRRYEVALDVIRRLRPTKLLDYGCGDGTFLAMLSEESERPAAVGAEIDRSQVDDCRVRLGACSNLKFLLVDELCRSEHQYLYDVIVCTEVLEHVIDVDSVLDHFDILLRPGGHLVISVPVETGLPLIIKQTARTVAGWRGLGDYPGTGSYTLPEFYAAVTAGPRRQLNRPVHRNADGTGFHDHKGFNWMALKNALRHRYRIHNTFGSPLAWLPPHLGSQAWFLASKE